MGMLALQFILLAAIIWLAGIHLTRSVDVLSRRMGMEQALGGMVLLAIVTNLPEVAIAVTAGLHHAPELAVGNILGGIAIQTVVIALMDRFRPEKHKPLSHYASSGQLILEGLFLLGILALVVMGNTMPAALVWHGIAPAELAIVLCWLVGLVVVRNARGPKTARYTDEHAAVHEADTWKVVAVFLAASSATLFAGYAIEGVSSGMAKELGMDGAIFGATFLALATSMPEISTGIEAVRMRKYQLAISDILGGNAFLPCLLLLTSFCAGVPALSSAKPSDLYVVALGALLTVLYTGALYLKPSRTVVGIGLESLLLVVVYLIGLFGLAAH